MKCSAVDKNFCVKSFNFFAV